MIRPSLLLPMVAFSIVSACQTGTQGEGESSDLKSSKRPAEAVAAIARTAQTCWFKSGNPVFKDLRMSNEVNSFAGRPRILLVKKSDPNGLPLLVVQGEQRGDTASGQYTQIEAFGPLLQSANGSRIYADIARWSKGNNNCKTS